MRTTKHNLTNKQILIEERYDDLRDLYRSENEDGARWPDIETMLDCSDEEYILEALDVGADELDLVALGEAPDLDAARVLIEQEDV